MKFEFFHLMPYRDLPEDFPERYNSVWGRHSQGALRSRQGALDV